MAGCVRSAWLRRYGPDHQVVVIGSGISGSRWVTRGVSSASVAAVQRRTGAFPGYQLGAVLGRLWPDGGLGGAGGPVLPLRGEGAGEGARRRLFCWTVKRWYVPAGRDLSPFSRWLPSDWRQRVDAAEQAAAAARARAEQARAASAEAAERARVAKAAEAGARRRLAEEAAVNAMAEAAAAADAEQARIAAEREKRAVEMREQAKAAAAAAREAKRQAVEEAAAEAEHLRAAQDARQKARADRAAAEEEQRKAAAEEVAACEAEGRKRTAGGRYLSDAEARRGTHKRAPGRRSRKNGRKKERKALEAEREKIAAQQRLLSAERAAFALQQSSTGERVSEVGRARAATASIADVGGRKQHQRLVDAGVRQMEELVRVAAEDPARLEQGLTGVVGRFVSETKKVTADMRRQQRQQQRQGEERISGAARKAAWRDTHLSQPQTKRHAGDKRRAREKRLGRKEKRQGGGRGGGTWGGRGGRGLGFWRR